MIMANAIDLVKRKRERREGGGKRRFSVKNKIEGKMGEKKANRISRRKKTRGRGESALRFFPTTTWPNRGTSSRLLYKKERRKSKEKPSRRPL